jgi:hypothetical protein
LYDSCQIVAVVDPGQLVGWCRQLHGSAACCASAWLCGGLVPFWLAVLSESTTASSHVTAGEVCTFPLFPATTALTGFCHPEFTPNGPPPFRAPSTSAHLTSLRTGQSTPWYTSCCTPWGLPAACMDGATRTCGRFHVARLSLLAQIAIPPTLMCAHVL